MKDIKGSTRLIALLGKPVRHSKSPYMHNKAFEFLNLDFAYMAFEIENKELGKSIEAMRTLDVKGFNITMPYKEEVMKYLDGVDDEAKVIGSVNTVVNHNGKFIGYNTDGKGFIKSLNRNKVEFKDEKLVIIGAGGAGKAIAIQLAFESAGEIVIANRSIEKADHIVMTINQHIPGVKARSIGLDENLLKEEIADSKILINTSSIGMDDSKNRSPLVNMKELHKDLFVADIIYNPKKTKFLLEAEKCDCKTMNGMGMLIYQGALAFELWTDSKMPEIIIEDILKSNEK